VLDKQAKPAILSSSLTNEETMPKVIGIRFGDNDFCDVAYAFLEGLKHRGIEDLTKQNVVTLWNNSVGGLYVLYQKRTKDLLELKEDDVENVKNHLRVNEDKIFFGKEVEKHLSEAFLNSEFAVIDGQNPHTGFYCYVT
jgi:hypothetical protein